MKDGAGGAETLAALLAQHGETLDGHARQTTWSGGWQYVFAYDPRARQGVNCYGPGLDGRNDGGFIVGPPSVVNGRPYTWSGAAQPQPMPEWLLEAKGATGARFGDKAPLSPLTTDRAAVETIHKWLAGAKPGTWAKVRCPSHDDGSPSLQVWKLDDGTARFRCYGGCNADVVAAVVSAPVDDGTWTGGLVWKRATERRIVVSPILDPDGSRR